jgi:hypothetical protein
MQCFICVVVKFLFIFKHDQSHVMINGDAHKFKGDNSSFYSPLQFEYYRLTTPDCPVSQLSAAESARDAWQVPTVGRGTGLSGVHRTVSGVPTAPRLQRSASPNKERDLHQTVSDGAPDCPVECSQRLLAALGL